MISDGLAGDTVYNRSVASVHTVLIYGAISIVIQLGRLDLAIFQSVRISKETQKRSKQINIKCTITRNVVVVYLIVVVI